MTSEHMNMIDSALLSDDILLPSKVRPLLARIYFTIVGDVSKNCRFVEIDTRIDYVTEYVKNFGSMVRIEGTGTPKAMNLVAEVLATKITLPLLPSGKVLTLHVDEVLENAPTLLKVLEIIIKADKARSDGNVLWGTEDV